MHAGRSFTRVPGACLSARNPVNTYGNGPSGGRLHSRIRACPRIQPPAETRVESSSCTRFDTELLECSCVRLIISSSSPCELDRGVSQILHNKVSARGAVDCPGAREGNRLSSCWNGGMPFVPPRRCRTPD